MDVASSFQALGISLGLGLLVGTQRERVDAPLAGVRTFSLITLFGTLSGMLALSFGPWVIAAGLAGVALTSAMGNALNLKEPRGNSGITTEIAILLMYGIGAYLVNGHRSVAVVLGGGIAVLLHAKPFMHGVVKKLGETDMRVMMQFVLITLVILPLLPDESFGPFEVLNLHDIWRLVVLVVGISLAGYIALKLYGRRTGVLIAGLIGGVISSTATTVSYARRAGEAASHVASSTIVVMLASTVVYVRVLIEVAALTPREFPKIAAPIVVMLVVSTLICLVLWQRTHRDDAGSPARENPTELRPALLFGATYALVLLIVAAARHQFGDRGLYVAAGISGLVDMDAITLGTSRMSAEGALAAGVVWRSILIATISNLGIKTAIAAFFGGRELGRRIALLFAIKVAVALILLFAWPD